MAAVGGNDDDDYDRENAIVSDALSDSVNTAVVNFYRRLDEVLAKRGEEGDVDTSCRATGFGSHHRRKKKRKNRRHGITHDDDYDIIKESAAPAKKRGNPIISLAKKIVWKVVAVAFICGITMTFIAWFALGCYGFYTLFFGGSGSFDIRSFGFGDFNFGRSDPFTPPAFTPLPDPVGQQDRSSIVIQIGRHSGLKKEGTSECEDSTEYCATSLDASTFAKSINLDDWKEMKSSIDNSIGQMRNSETYN